MSTKVSYAIIIGIIIASIVAGVLVYPAMPDKLASHWNAAGEVNGYMSKFWGVFLLPIVIAAMFLLFIIIPRIDPMKENIAAFRRTYNFLIVFIIFVLTFFYGLSIAWNLGGRFNFARYAIAALGIMVFAIGVMLPKMKRNWFVGIRTPWTLSSDIVWEKTHIHGGIIFKALGVFTVLTAFTRADAFLVSIVLLLAATLWLFIYSYLLYKKIGAR